MNPLERLKPEDLVSLADPAYREAIKKRSRALSARAMDTFEDIMSTSDDDMARLTAADKIMKYSEAQEEQKLLPQGVSEEVFRIALAGLVTLKTLAATSQNESILRNVTPASADPRPKALVEKSLLDDSPLNRAEGPSSGHSPEEALPEPAPSTYHERFEIIDPTLESTVRRHEEDLEEI